MSVVAANASVTPPLPSGRCWQWCMHGFRIWRRAPLKLVMLCTVLLVAEALLQTIPTVGVALSKCLVPILGLGILAGLDEQNRGKPLRWSCLYDVVSQKRFTQAMGLVAISALPVIAVQQAAVWLVHGWPAVDAVLLGHQAAHRELMTPGFIRLLVLPGSALSILVVLAGPAWLLGGYRPWRALRLSIDTVVHHPAPFGMFLLVNLACMVLILSAHWTFLLILLYLPWATACGYAIWDDLRAMLICPAVA
jgi:hypothetical protein